MICEAEDPEGAFAYFLDKASNVDTSGEKEVTAHFTALQMQTLQKELGGLIKGILDKLISKRLDKETFYRELWKNINSDILFENEEQKIFALYQVWIDGRIPYFQIMEGLKMSDTEFQNLLKEKEELLKEIAFIMNLDFSQKTERSSILLKALETCENDKEKSVVLTYIMNLVEVNILKLLTAKNKR